MCVACATPTQARKIQFFQQHSHQTLNTPIHPFSTISLGALIVSDNAYIMDPTGRQVANLRGTHARFVQGSPYAIIEANDHIQAIDLAHQQHIIWRLPIPKDPRWTLTRPHTTHSAPACLVGVHDAQRVWTSPTCNDSEGHVFYQHDPISVYDLSSGQHLWSNSGKLVASNATSVLVTQANDKHTSIRVQLNDARTGRVRQSWHLKSQAALAAMESHHVAAGLITPKYIWILTDGWLDDKPHYRGSALQLWRLTRDAVDPPQPIPLTPEGPHHIFSLHDLDFEPEDATWMSALADHLLVQTADGTLYKIHADHGEVEWVWGTGGPSLLVHDDKGPAAVSFFRGPRPRAEPMTPGTYHWSTTASGEGTRDWVLYDPSQHAPSDTKVNVHPDDHFFYAWTGDDPRGDWRVLVIRPELSPPAPPPALTLGTLNGWCYEGSPAMVSSDVTIAGITYSTDDEGRLSIPLRAGGHLRIDTSIDASSVVIPIPTHGTRVFIDLVTHDERDR